MELLYASCVGVLVTCGVFLLLRARTFPVVLGLTMISYAVNQVIIERKLSKELNFAFSSFYPKIMTPVLQIKLPQSTSSITKLIFLIFINL